MERTFVSLSVAGLSVDCRRQTMKHGEPQESNELESKYAVLRED